jgi:hypothetical protein
MNIHTGQQKIYDQIASPGPIQHHLLYWKRKKSWGGGGGGGVVLATPV